MINLKTREKVIAGVSLVVICFAGGILFSRLYQTPHKTMLIYKDALADYRKEDYSNSYYLFSRVSAMSELKPAALYRQAACASAIGDKESALKKYRTLYSHYAKNPLSPRAKYLAAQIFFENNDLKHASKCFKQLMKEAPASEVLSFRSQDQDEKGIPEDMARGRLCHPLLLCEEALTAILQMYR